MLGDSGKYWVAILRLDVFAHLGQRFIGHAGRIGTHISNEADQALLAQFHTFIQALRDHHGALDAEAQLARGVLLQLAGGEWRSCIAAAFFAIDRPDQPVGVFQSDANLFRIFAVGDFDLLFTFAQEPGVECRRLAQRRGWRQSSNILSFRKP